MRWPIGFKAQKGSKMGLNTMRNLVSWIGKEIGIKKLTLASGRRSFATQLSVYMQKGRETIVKGTKHSLGRGNMSRYIDCSKSSMASPSRALSEQRKLAKIIKGVHEQEAKGKLPGTPERKAINFDEHKAETPPQPRGVSNSVCSPTEFRVLRKYLHKRNVSADHVLSSHGPNLQYPPLVNHMPRMPSVSGVGRYNPYGHQYIPPNSMIPYLGPQPVMYNPLIQQRYQGNVQFQGGRWGGVQCSIPMAQEASNSSRYGQALMMNQMGPSQVLMMNQAEPSRYGDEKFVRSMQKERQDAIPMADPPSQTLVLPKLEEASIVDEKVDDKKLSQSGISCAAMDECDIGITNEEAQGLDVEELPVAFKLALKRLVKFRKKQRDIFGNIPSVRNDPLCKKAFLIIKRMQLYGQVMGINLKLCL